MNAGGFSIVIPTFQRSSTVGAAIGSALSQQGPDVEVVLVDDGSTDSTAEVLADFDDERLVVLRQANAGRCAARNAGVERAGHDWLIFLDSDDELLPGALSTFEAGRAAGASLLVAPLKRRLNGGQRIDGDIQWDEVRGLPWGLQAGAFAIERILLREVGGYCPYLHHSEHTEMAFRLRRLTPKPIVSRLSNPTVTIQDSERIYDPALQYQSATHLLEHLSQEMAEDREARAVYLGIAGEAAGRLGRRYEATTLLGRSLAAKPRFRTAARLLRAAIHPPRTSAPG